MNLKATGGQAVGEPGFAFQASHELQRRENLVQLQPSGRSEMIFMVTTIAIAVVAFFWIKTRRQRKDEAANRMERAA